MYKHIWSNDRTSFAMHIIHKHEVIYYILAIIDIYQDWSKEHQCFLRKLKCGGWTDNVDMIPMCHPVYAGNTLKGCFTLKIAKDKNDGIVCVCSNTSSWQNLTLTISPFCLNSNHSYVETCLILKFCLFFF